jgi:hypothetical protein
MFRPCINCKRGIASDTYGIEDKIETRRRGRGRTIIKIINDEEMC